MNYFFSLVPILILIFSVTTFCKLKSDLSFHKNIYIYTYKNIGYFVKLCENESEISFGCENEKENVFIEEYDAVFVLLTSINYCESPADLYVKKESDSIQLECFKKSKNSICQLKSKFIKNLFKKDLSINSDLYYDKPARIEFNYTCGIYGNKS